LAKDTLLNAVKKLLSRKRKNNKRYQKLFVQRRMKKKISWNDLKTWAVTVKDASVGVIQSATDSITSLGQQLLKAKDAVKTQIALWWDAIKSSKLYQFIVKWSNCISALSAVAGGLYTLVSLGTFISKTATTQGASLVLDIPRMLVNLLCSWYMVVEAAQHFLKAWDSANVLDKYYKYGRFFGIMIYVIIYVVTGKRHHKRLHKKSNKLF